MYVCTYAYNTCLRNETRTPANVVSFFLTPASRLFVHSSSTRPLQTLKDVVDTNKGMPRDNDTAARTAARVCVWGGSMCRTLPSAHMYHVLHTVHKEKGENGCQWFLKGLELFQREACMYRRSYTHFEVHAHIDYIERKVKTAVVAVTEGAGAVATVISYV